MPRAGDRGYRSYAGAARYLALSGAKQVSNYMIRKGMDKLTGSKKSYDKTLNKKVEMLNKQVKSLKIKQARKDELDAKLTYKKRQVDRLLSGVNSSAHIEKGANNVSLIETALGQLRYYDPSTPGTYITADFTTGTQSKVMRISGYSKCYVRNNYQVPTHCTIYCCVPKTDTSILPLTAYVNGMIDIGITSADTNQQVYITDSPQFNDLWKIVKSERKWLNTGDKLTLTTNIKPFSYDPSLTDSHPQTYQKVHNSHVYVIRLEGELGHDSVSDLQGFLQSSVDFYVDTKYTILYDAGAAIEYMVVSDDSSTFPNVGVIANQPVADNQGYIYS